MKIVYLVSIILTCLINFKCQTIDRRARFNSLDDIIRRYYECQHLKMVKSSESGKYIPDALIVGNNLNESFFEAKIGKLTLEKSLDLQRNIYKSVYNCSSQFCQCVGLIDNEMPESYLIYFRNDDLFAEYKKAVLNYTKTLVDFDSSDESSSNKNYDFFKDIMLSNLFGILGPNCIDQPKDVYVKIFNFIFFFNFLMLFLF